MRTFPQSALSLDKMTKLLRTLLTNETNVNQNAEEETRSVPPPVIVLPPSIQ